jgi:hypothetical protein
MLTFLEVLYDHQNTCTTIDEASKAAKNKNKLILNQFTTNSQKE